MMRHDRRRRSQRLRRQLLAGFAFIGLLIGVVALPLASETDAAWVDSEHGRGTFSAVVVQAPSAIDFSLCRDFGTVPVPPDSQQMVTIRWRWAAPMPGSVSTTWTVGGDAISPTTTGPVNGVYSSTFTAGQLRSVESPAFGANYDLVATARVATTQGSTWQSSPKELAQVRSSWGLTLTCTITA
ncbi:hypothetical protein [Agrococcus casei]|uniref:hypothetical protein n=1 Tax=Agrococcus casei TaxID=343512 RepID=UPI003F908963